MCKINEIEDEGRHWREGERERHTARTSKTTTIAQTPISSGAGNLLNHSLSLVMRRIPDLNADYPKNFGS